MQSSDLEDEEDINNHRRRAGRRKQSRGEVGYEKLWNAGGKDEQDDDELEHQKLKRYLFCRKFIIASKYLVRSNF